MFEIAVNFSSTGDNTIVAAIVGKRIRVYRFFFVANAATSIVFKDGATALTGALPLAANGAFVLDKTVPEPWFTTTAGNAFVINQTGTAQISGRLYYTQS